LILRGVGGNKNSTLESESKKQTNLQEKMLVALGAPGKKPQGFVVGKIRGI
jgi:hypothetical protein